jgi:pantetheine-phosphate adenylyltransferase
VTVKAFGGLAVQAAADVGADFIVKGLLTPNDFDIEQQMAHTNHSVTGVRTVFLPCRADFGFVSSRFIREIAAHGEDVGHLVATPVADALADRFASPAD